MKKRVSCNSAYLYQIFHATVRISFETIDERKNIFQRWINYLWPCFIFLLELAHFFYSDIPNNAAYL